LYGVLERELRARRSTKEARTARRQLHKENVEASTSAEGAMYGPGIDDSM